MDVKLLIDAIMRQTTVLIAELATTAGLRAPLAHVADTVFLELSKELEAQGVPRKIVADMFGLALRGYQKRIHRLEEVAGNSGQTLWQAVLDHLTRHGPVTRRTLFRDFQKDDPGALGSVLSDLVSSGFVSRTGSGESSVYGVTHEEERSLMAREGNLDTVCSLFWLEIAKHPGVSADELAPYLSLSAEIRDQALALLLADGRVSLTNARYYTDGMVIPVGATQGWEVAVLDHFHSVCGGIVRKLRANVTRSGVADIVGGATLTFDVEPGHPEYAEVRLLLRTIRSQVNELWDRVEAHNATHPISESILERVTFYFGQFTDAEDTDS